MPAPGLRSVILARARRIEPLDGEVLEIGDARDYLHDDNGLNSPPRGESVVGRSFAHRFPVSNQEKSQATLLWERRSNV
jgi:hypothetical protein